MVIADENTPQPGGAGNFALFFGGSGASPSISGENVAFAASGLLGGSEGVYLASGRSCDCNGNSTPDDCDIAQGTSDDCTTNGVPDECEPDCNGNTVADSCEIAGGTATDVDGNNVPDECELTCFDTCGDINGSGGNVDLVDFATLALCFLRSGPGPGCGPNAFACSDMNGNGLVNLVDFATFALWFQNSTTQSPPDCTN